MSEKAVAQTEGKELVEVSDDEINALIEKNAELQKQENAGDGVRADYLLLAKSNCKALKKSSELFIEGLKLGDIYIQKDKLNFGSELKVVPLAFITIYNEKEDETKDSQFYGVWNKEQAVKFPLVRGSNFNRQIPGGHVLIPVNWVMVTVVGRHEIENAVIAFKSTGSRIWRKWKEDAKSRSASSATLVYTIKEEEYSNADYEWTDFGFEYTENLLETDKNEALFCLKKSNAIRESYEKHTLIGDHDLNSVNSKPVAGYVTDDTEASDTEDSFDDEENGF